MALTAESAFGEFLNRITPSSTVEGEAQTRADYAVELLKKGFTTGEVYPTGSIFRGTGLKNISDADVIVEVDLGSRFNLTPQRMLDSVREHMSPLHRGTQARADGQAITLHFKTWPNVDIVPAKVGRDLFLPAAEFEIPDVNSGNWLATHPKKHDQLTRGFSEETKHLVRLIKYWSYKHSKCLQSFHIETLVLNQLIEWQRRVSMWPKPPYKPNDSGWTWAVLHFFSESLKKYGIEPVWSEATIPEGIGLFAPHTMHPVQQIGRVDQYISYANRREVLQRMLNAYKLAQEAWLAEREGKEADAISFLGRLFGDKFPSYG